MYKTMFSADTFRGWQRPKSLWWTVTWAVKEVTKRRKCGDERFHFYSPKGVKELGVETHTDAVGPGL